MIKEALDWISERARKPIEVELANRSPHRKRFLVPTATGWEPRDFNCEPELPGRRSPHSAFMTKYLPAFRDYIADTAALTQITPYVFFYADDDDPLPQSVTGHCIFDYLPPKDSPHLKQGLREHWAKAHLNLTPEGKAINKLLLGSQQREKIAHNRLMELLEHVEPFETKGDDDVPGDNIARLKRLQVDRMTKSDSYADHGTRELNEFEKIEAKSGATRPPEAIYLDVQLYEGLDVCTPLELQLKIDLTGSEVKFSVVIPRMHEHMMLLLDAMCETVCESASNFEVNCYIGEPIAKTSLFELT